MDSDTINRKFTKAYNKIHYAYDAADESDEDTLNECFKQALELLKEPAIPRLHTIKTKLLLASIVGDYQQVLHYHHEADILLRIIRTQEVRGTNARVDAALDELQESVVEIRDVLAQEAAARIEDLLEDVQKREDEMREGW